MNAFPVPTTTTTNTTDDREMPPPFGIFRVDTYDRVHIHTQTEEAYRSDKDYSLVHRDTQRLLERKEKIKHKR